MVRRLQSTSLAAAGWCQEDRYHSGAGVITGPLIDSVASGVEVHRRRNWRCVVSGGAVRALSGIFESRDQIPNAFQSKDRDCRLSR